MNIMIFRFITMYFNNSSSNNNNNNDSNSNNFKALWYGDGH